MYDEVINALNIFSTTADDTLSKIQESYYGQCYTAYPNFIIADVSDSTIRNPRNQEEHSKKMRWNLRNNYV
jgi:hypothetical protein